jgi:large subunit ribosomal protein L28
VERVIPTRFDLGPRLTTKRMGTMRSTLFLLARPSEQPTLDPFQPFQTTMARVCAITGRRPVKGNIINRKGQSKKSGGIGTHVTSITRRKFRPNLQRVRIQLPNGGTKRVWVSVKALKAGLVTKA